jgi:hypothetical protein
VNGPAIAIQNSRFHSFGIDFSAAMPPRIQSVIDSISTSYRSATQEWPSSWSVTLTKRPIAATTPMNHGVAPARSRPGSNPTPVSPSMKPA